MNRKVLSLLLSLITTFFIILKFNIEPVIGIIVLVISFILINYSLKTKKKKYNKLSIVLSIILSIIYVVCDSIEKTYFIDIFNKYLLLNLSGYFLIFYFSLINLFSFIDKYKKKEEVDRKIYIKDKEILTTSKFSFIINFALFFVINLALLIKFFPGNLTYDSYNELMQAKGIVPLINNHSILHTSILMLFVKFGMLFKSMNLGVFLYSLFQISLVSLVFSYILYFMAKYKVPIIFRVIALFFLAFHPINVIYSISLWKDIIFSLCFVFFTILVYYYSNEENYFDNKKNIIIFILVSIVLMYLRNNAVYVVILSLIIMFIINRKNYKKILPIFLGIIVLFFSSKIIIFKALNIKDAEVKEMLSFPSQSIARIYKNDNLNKKDKEEIEKFYSKEIGEVYNPIISDNTKDLLNQKYFSKHKSEYIKLNMRLFFKHSNRYIESFVSNSYGYYYMNTHYPSIILQISDDLGVKHANIDTLYIFLFFVLLSTIIVLIVLWNLIDKKNILLIGLMLPVVLSLSTSIKDNSIISLLFSIGFYVTITFLSFIYNLKNKNNVIYYIPSIILWFSILFSPVYSEFRYLYPIFLLVPVFIGMTFKKTD